jgi:ribose transport system substrate-binding protein
MIRLLGGKGKVVVLRYQVGSASTDEREAGFFEAIAKAKGIQVISENRYAGPTVGEAKTASMNMVDKLKMADGIFCPNESSTMGMLLALRQIERAGKVKFVGFDTSGPLVEALRAGELDGLIAQDPRRMGYEGVTILVKQIKGQKAPAAIDTGARLITRENIDEPEIKKILQTP